jgi:hypothetical protein
MPEDDEDTRYLVYLKAKIFFGKPVKIFFFLSIRFRVWLAM